MGYGRFYAFGKNAKHNQDGRSRKFCVCGGHSANDVKKNLHHNSTLKRLWIKRNRRFKQQIYRGIYE